MFKITGDMIEYDGHQVAVLRQDVIPTVRNHVFDALEGYDPDDDALEDALDEVKAREEDISDMRDDIKELEDELTDCATALTDCETERDTYAALLGIKR